MLLFSLWPSIESFHLRISLYLYFDVYFDNYLRWKFLSKKKKKKKEINSGINVFPVNTQNDSQIY